MIFAPFFLVGTPYQSLASFIFNSTSILLCIYAIQESRKQFVIGIVAAIIVILINQSGVFRDSARISFFLSFILYIIFYFFVAVRLIKLIFNTERVRIGVFYAAIIVYLLIGIIGGYLFMLIENAAPGSLCNLTIDHLNNPSEFFYFSFVTLSTLGYGDIFPVSAPAQALSMMLSISGPLYLTILVALLVSRFEHSDIHM
jgi:hypothetical protein